jgi:hypothetical protein
MAAALSCGSAGRSIHMREASSSNFLERGVQRIIHAPSLHEKRRPPKRAPYKQSETA